MTIRLKNLLKSIISSFMALVILLCCFGNIVVYADNSKVNDCYTGDGYNVYYSVVNQWTGHYQIEITIENTGNDTISNWALKYDAQGTISNIWNAEIYRNDDTKYIIRNSGYNYEILPSQSVSFGYIVESDACDIPKTFELCVKRVQRSDNVYISYNITDEWNTGFVCNITINNPTDTPIEAWRLKIENNFKIDNLWNAVILDETENTYTFSDTIATNPIAPASSVSFGFTAIKNGEINIGNFELSEVVIDDDFETINEEIIKLSLTGYAEYDSESSSILFTWTSTIENGTFYVMTSDDNLSYNVLISTDSTVGAVYKNDSDFDIKYFKIRQVTNDMRVAFSEVICLKKDSSGYKSDFLDSDDDGIPDYMEKTLGTNIHSSDTDNDGLTDYQEVYVTYTDPTVYDSVTSGVSDADADSDNDGLSNNDELSKGTSPILSDSDYDNILDGLEVNKYKTDPLMFDSDGDGIGDGDEITVGLNPLTKYTFEGIYDPEYVFEVSISSDSSVFDNINTNENPYELSVSIKAAGNVSDNLVVHESGYSKAISNDAILGSIAEISYDETCTVDEVVIKFEIDQDIIDEQVMSGSENIDNGINRFSIFKYFEEDNIILPIVTDVDANSNTIYSTVDTLGTYFVVDMVKYLEIINEGWEKLSKESSDTENVINNALEASPELNTNSITLAFNEGSYLSEETEFVNSGSIDVFLFVDARGIYNCKPGEVKNCIKEIGETVVSTSENANVYIVEYVEIGDSNKYIVHKGAGDSFACKDELDVRNAADSVYIPQYLEMPSYYTMLDFSSAFDAVTCYADFNTPTYCFCIFENKGVYYNSENAYDILNELIENGVDISIVTTVDNEDECKNGYAVRAYTDSNGIFIKNYNDFSTEAIMHIYGSLHEIDDKMFVIVSTGLKPLDLAKDLEDIYAEYCDAKEKIIAETGIAGDKINVSFNDISLYDSEEALKNSGYTDSDHDGVYDFAEIDFGSDLMYNEKNDFELPTYEKCIKKYKEKYFYVEGGIEKYYIDSIYDEITAKKRLEKTIVIPLVSDPMSSDSDEDGFVDYYELKYNNDKTVNDIPDGDYEIYYLEPLKYTEWEAHNDTARFTRISGFSYDPKQKTIYSTLNCPQRFFGFCETIDYAADPVLSSSIYCDPIYFYYNDREYLLELWKGQYGIMTGVEVGLYYRNPCMIKKTTKLSDRIAEFKQFVDDNSDLIDDVLTRENLLLQFISEDYAMMQLLNKIGIKPSYFVDVLYNLEFVAAKIIEFFGLDTEETLIYYDDSAEKWYRSADDDNLIKVNVDLKTDYQAFKSDNIINNKSTDDVEIHREDNHWWITGFEWGKYTNWEDELYVEISIEFSNNEMVNAFLEGGALPDYCYENSIIIDKYYKENQKKGFNSINPDPSKLYLDNVINNTVYLTYKINGINSQPQSKEDKKLIQGNNDALIDVYEYAKNECGIGYKYDSNRYIEKLLYTNDPNLISVKSFENGLFNTGFLLTSEHNLWLAHSGLIGILGFNADFELVESLLCRMVKGNFCTEYGYAAFTNTLRPLFENVIYLLDSGTDIVYNYLKNNDVRLISNISAADFDVDEYQKAVNEWFEAIVYKSLSNIANQQYPFKGKMLYLYEFYPIWYNEYCSIYGIDNYVGNDQQINYAFNHIFGMTMSAKFITDKILSKTDQ